MQVGNMGSASVTLMLMTTVPCARPQRGRLHGPASLTLTQSCEVGTAVGPNLQGKKLRLRTAE